MPQKFILLVEDNPDDEALTRRAGLGANSYIRKPVDFGQCVEAVRQLGLYWLVLNEPPPPRRRRLRPGAAGGGRDGRHPGRRGSCPRVVAG